MEKDVNDMNTVISALKPQLIWKCFYAKKFVNSQYLLPWEVPRINLKGQQGHNLLTSKCRYYELKETNNIRKLMKKTQDSAD